METWNAALSCFDVYHVDTQHLAREGTVHDSWDDLLAIRGGLAIVDLTIVSVGNPDDDSCTRSHGDGCLEVLLIYDVPDRGIMIQPIHLFGFGDFDSPLRPIHRADRTTGLEVWVRGVGRISSNNRGRFENAANAQTSYTVPGFPPKVNDCS